MFNQKLPQSQLPGDVSYLASDFHKHIQSGAVTSQQFSDPHLLLEAYRQRARRYLHVHVQCINCMCTDNVIDFANHYSLSGHFVTINEKSEYCSFMIAN